MHFITLIIFLSLLKPIKHLHLYTKYQPQTNQNYKLLSCTVATCKTIDDHYVTNYSRSCLTVDWPKPWSAFLHCHTNFNVFQNFLSLGSKFQTIAKKATTNNAIEISNITFPEFNNNISIDTQIAYLIDKSCWYKIIFGAHVSLINSDSSSSTWIISLNVWTIIYLSRIQISSSTIICLLISMMNLVGNAVDMLPTCLNVSQMS